MKYLLSVVVLTYQDNQNCLSTLESLEGMTEAEIIVVDGNDIPSEVVLERVKDLNKGYQHFPSSTIQQAMNLGLTVSQGKWVWFLNSGDELDNAGELLLTLKAHHDAGLFIGNAKIRFPDGQLNLWIYPGFKDWKLAYGIKTFCHQACIFDRNKLIAFGGYPDDSHFDTIVIYYFVKEHKVTLVPNFEVMYLAGGRSSRESLVDWGMSNYKSRYKHRQIYNPHLFFDVVVFAFYILVRCCLNLLLPSKRRNWWRVGN